MFQFDLQTVSFLALKNETIIADIEHPEKRVSARIPANANTYLSSM
jgi:hypothetical protein